MHRDILYLWFHLIGVCYLVLCVRMMHRDILYLWFHLVDVCYLVLCVIKFFLIYSIFHWLLVCNEKKTLFRLFIPYVKVEFCGIKLHFINPI